MAGKMKVRKVSDMRINEISLVDLPANVQSSVVLMKRAEQPPEVGADTPADGEDDMPKTLEELAKALADAQDEIAKLSTENETLKKAADDLKKAAGSAGAGQQAADEDVLKALPEELRKRFLDNEARAKAAEEAIAKAADEKVTQECIAKAATLSYLPVKPEEFGPVLKALPADARAEVLRVLDAANGIAKTASLYGEVGSVAKGTTNGANSPIVKAAQSAADAAKK